MAASSVVIASCQIGDGIKHASNGIKNIGDGNGQTGDGNSHVGDGVILLMMTLPKPCWHSNFVGRIGPSVMAFTGPMIGLPSSSMAMTHQMLALSNGEWIPI